MCVYLYAILCMYHAPLKHTCWMTLWSHGMCLQLLCWNILWSYLLRPRFPMVYARVCNHHPRPSVSTQANSPWSSTDSDLHWLVGRGSHCIYATEIKNEIKNPHYFRVDVRVFPLTSVSWGGGEMIDEIHLLKFQIWQELAWIGTNGHRSFAWESLPYQWVTKWEPLCQGMAQCHGMSILRSLQWWTTSWFHSPSSQLLWFGWPCLGTALPQHPIGMTSGWFDLG